ncbi:MAG: hypothetical protein HOG05_03840 [Bacteroidetes bacterium]|jgi:hypothetical protein|nr:hypothetical protein [Bacteroidota bacterium]MBT5528476.1 hypothetical protein [Cytophagia bacterium]MBT3423874.1 hypothetical protein [Bacteroidota bacterium]MBT3800259.1 hypothetical protein [Bacteroidota bacterium]MBT3935244.1 hypothetical protein [Bacteroidota bacterium]
MEILSIHMHTSGVFWGIMVLVLGILLVIKQVFNLDFPIGKVMFGVFLISFGMKMLFFKTDVHEHKYVDKGNVIFGNEDLRYVEDQYEYNVIFSSSDIDLRDMDAFPTHAIEISTVFGDARVIIDKYMKVDINSDAVFGAVQHPSAEIENPLDSLSQNNILRINASAVFGNIKFVRD